MMKKYFILSLISLLCVVQVSLFAQNAWTHDKGHGFVKVAQWWIVADEHFTGNGEKAPNTTNGLFNTSIYAEYGITDRLTAIVYFPFLSRNLMNETVSGTTGQVIQEGEAINTIGDTDLSIKYGILRDTKVKLSTILTLGLPLGETGRGTLGGLQTGDGEFNQMLTLATSFGASSPSVNSFFSAYAAYNNRTNNFSDEFRYGIEAGAIFKNRIMLIGRLYGIESLQNGGTNVSDSNLFGNNSEHLTISPELGVFITKKFGVSATYAYPLSGEILFSDPAYSVGVFLNF